MQPRQNLILTKGNAVPGLARLQTFQVSALRGLQVLVVEDEFYIAAALQSYLEDAGAKIHTVATVAEANAFLDAASVSGAVLDIRLSRDVVYRLADRLVANDVVVVFFSADFFTMPSRFARFPQISKDQGVEVVAQALLVAVALKRSGLDGKNVEILQTNDQLIRALRMMARALVADTEVADAMVEQALRHALALVETGAMIPCFPTFLAELLERTWIEQKLLRRA